MATISTHHGHNGSGGSGASQDHNKREAQAIQYQDHIDPQGAYEVWLHEDVRDAYKRVFGDAVREYDERQRRNDRKIGDYYSSVKRSGEATYHELIVGVYSDDREYLKLKPGEQREILREYAESFVRDNASMEIIGIYYHADEESRSPHLHLDYIPVGQGYKRGPELQISETRALAALGYRSLRMKDTAQMQWERAENDRLQRLCEQHGLHVEHPMRDHELERREHESTRLYKVRQQVRDSQHELHELRESIDRHTRTLETVLQRQKPEPVRVEVEEIPARKRIFRDDEPERVVMTRADYAQLLHEVQELRKKSVTYVDARRVADRLDRDVQRLTMDDNERIYTEYREELDEASKSVVEAQNRASESAFEVYQVTQELEELRELLHDVRDDRDELQEVVDELRSELRELHELVPEQELDARRRERAERQERERQQRRQRSRGMSR